MASKLLVHMSNWFDLILFMTSDRAVSRCLECHEGKIAQIWSRSKL